ncbi:MAG: tRNA (guanosine(37)-N1)-methyltransferase TrmD [Spirochaetales bacterium]
MKFTVLSLFPEILEGFFQSSLMKKAVERGLVAIEFVNIRDFATDKHRTCDDIPYGGGAGMVLKPEPLARALDSVGAGQKRTLYPTPSGRLFKQATAQELAAEEELVFICGRYEGIDQRIIDEYVDDEISLGDYVMSSGEIATLVIIDAVYRLREGVIKAHSLEEESFSGGFLLEYPQYTRPELFRERTVPEVLLSGHHKNILQWRSTQSLEKTKRLRPDLLG